MSRSDNPRPNPFQRLVHLILLVGPGIFCLGYTIGTGSVTSMAIAGSRFGMQLLWVLLLSCLFSWVLMEAYGRYAVVTGGTALRGIRTHLRFGRFLALLTLTGVVIGQWTALSGLVGLASNLIYESLRLFIPSVPENGYGAVIVIAAVILGATYSLLFVGRYSFFEKILVVFVTIMGVGFIVSMFVVMPSPEEIARGLIPSIPDVKGATLLVVAFVGTTMAAPTFVVRPLLMKGKGWGSDNRREQSRDAFVSALLVFIISGSIMACATGALYYQGKSIENVLDMVTTLEPIAGRFAVGLFLVGTLSAGLSSIFPCAMVLPLLIADYRSGELQVHTPMFRILTGIACVAALTVPVFGANPLSAQIATQIAQVFVLPLVVGCIFFLVNRKDLMGEYRAGILMNIGIVAAFGFSLVMSYLGVIALARMFS